MTRTLVLTNTSLAKSVCSFLWCRLFVVSKPAPCSFLIPDASLGQICTWFGIWVADCHDENSFAVASRHFPMNVTLVCTIFQTRDSVFSKSQYKKQPLKERRLDWCEDTHTGCHFFTCGHTIDIHMKEKVTWRKTTWAHDGHVIAAGSTNDLHVIISWSHSFSSQQVHSPSCASSDQTHEEGHGQALASH